MAYLTPDDLLRPRRLNIPGSFSYDVSWDPQRGRIAGLGYLGEITAPTAAQCWNPGYLENEKQQVDNANKQYRDAIASLQGQSQTLQQVVLRLQAIENQATSQSVASQASSAVNRASQGLAGLENAINAVRTLWDRHDQELQATHGTPQGGCPYQFGAGTRLNQILSEAMTTARNALAAADTRSLVAQAESLEAQIAREAQAIQAQAAAESAMAQQMADQERARREQQQLEQQRIAAQQQQALEVAQRAAEAEARQAEADRQFQLQLVQLKQQGESERLQWEREQAARAEERAHELELARIQAEAAANAPPPPVAPIPEPPIQAITPGGDYFSLPTGYMPGGVSPYAPVPGQTPTQIPGYYGIPTAGYQYGEAPYQAPYPQQATTAVPGPYQEPMLTPLAMPQPSYFAPGAELFGVGGLGQLQPADPRYVQATATLYNVNAPYAQRVAACELLRGGDPTGAGAQAVRIRGNCRAEVDAMAAAQTTPQGIPAGATIPTSVATEEGALDQLARFITQIAPVGLEAGRLATGGGAAPPMAIQPAPASGLMKGLGLLALAAGGLYVGSKVLGKRKRRR